MPPDPIRYLVEWYSPAGEAPAVGAAGAVELLLTISVPTDEVAFGLFAAESAEAVERACRAAGHPPARITAAVGTLPPRTPGAHT